jgi:hypothetical protein
MLGPIESGLGERVRSGKEQRSWGKRLWSLSALALAAAAAGSLPAATAGQRSKTQDFALFVSYRMTRVPLVPSGLYRAVGTFSATGRVSDSGTASSAYRITARGPDAVRSVETFRGKRGTLAVRFQASVVSVGKRKISQRPGPARVFGVGAWRIASGTRSYAELRGKTGTMGYMIDFRRRTTSILYILP